MNEAWTLPKTGRPEAGQWGRRCRLAGRPLAAFAFAGTLAAGCGGGEGLLPPGGAPLPAAPAASGEPAGTEAGTPTEVYTRIARGALACWFGPSRPLQGAYVYTAEAEPVSRGGGAEIVLRERDARTPSKRGARAFRISIVPENGKTRLEFENLRMAETLAAGLQADAVRWKDGETGCRETGTEPGWTTEPPKRESPPAATRTKRASPGLRQRAVDGFPGPACCSVPENGAVMPVRRAG